ncbi:hypothetical protein M0R45_028131 [Rubus argutus]|uniref:Secreted protein n=1 Tax=Rubus argutus TaxID=59490 RepID=A0AAW1W6D6_RUBAR
MWSASWWQKHVPANYVAVSMATVAPPMTTAPPLRGANASVPVVVEEVVVVESASNAALFFFPGVAATVELLLSSADWKAGWWICCTRSDLGACWRKCTSNYQFVDC